MALQLCQQATILCAHKRCKQVEKICSFVSTLCKISEKDSCKEESGLCVLRAKNCKGGNCSMAEKMCKRAKIICLKNYEILGG